MFLWAGVTGVLILSSNDQRARSRAPEKMAFNKIHCSFTVIGRVKLQIPLKYGYSCQKSQAMKRGWASVRNIPRFIMDEMGSNKLNCRTYSDRRLGCGIWLITGRLSVNYRREEQCFGRTARSAEVDPAWVSRVSGHPSFWLLCLFWKEYIFKTCR